jgi:hypothetical protein
LVGSTFRVGTQAQARLDGTRAWRFDENNEAFAAQRPNLSGKFLFLKDLRDSASEKEQTKLNEKRHFPSNLGKNGVNYPSARMNRSWDLTRRCGHEILWPFRRPGLGPLK